MDAVSIAEYEDMDAKQPSIIQVLRAMIKGPKSLLEIRGIVEMNEIRRSWGGGVDLLEVLRLLSMLRLIHRSRGKYELTHLGASKLKSGR